MDLPPTRSSSSGGPADQTIAIQNFPHCIAGSLCVRRGRLQLLVGRLGRGIAALFRKRFSRTVYALQTRSSSVLHENDDDDARRRQELWTWRNRGAFEAVTHFWLTRSIETAIQGHFEMEFTSEY